MRKETLGLMEVLMRLILIVLWDCHVASSLWGVLNLRCMQGIQDMEVQWVLRATGLKQKRDRHTGDTDWGAGHLLVVVKAVGMHETSQVWGN